MSLSTQVVVPCLMAFPPSPHGLSPPIPHRSVVMVKTRYMIFLFFSSSTFFIARYVL
ncbi:hypothetical protein LY78DRAFT_274259 [Colletotrichum sublineola]|nr:hypothetical protein LY78DRAFT_274259 [Colletotrichum sublineola]